MADIPRTYDTLPQDRNTCDQQSYYLDNDGYVRKRVGGFVLPGPGFSNYLDPFSRLQVSNPTTIFSSHHRYSKHELLFTEKLTGSGTSTLEKDIASVKLAVTTASGDKVTRQTRHNMPYFPSKTSIIFFTGNFDGNVSGVRKRYGYFDDNDGAFVELDGTSAYFVLRTSTSGTPTDARKVAQADWDDPMDGTGPSGKTIDWTMQQVFIIKAQWLGSGMVQLLVNIDGISWPVHTFQSANMLNIPYAQGLDLPIRAEIENVSGGSATEMHMTCVSCVSDGGDIEEGAIRELSTEATALSVAVTETPLMAIRLKSDALRFSAKVVEKSFAMVSGTSSVIIRTYYLPTVTVSPWTSLLGTESILEAAQGTTAITAFSGGYLLNTEFMRSGGNIATVINTDFQSDISLGSDLDGNADILLLTGQSTSGNATILGNIRFREYQ